jgi:pimeloyl-ACP methyl ester carboxylesterase
MPKIGIGDAQVHYHVHGEGEPLLLIAGLASDLYTWKKVLPELAKHHQVIVFDNRGSGLTETSAADFTIATLSDDAAGLLQFLGIHKAHVVGWSMGGNVAQEFALRHPEKLGALVLMSTYMKSPDRSRFALDVLIQSAREGASMETFMMMMQAWGSTNPAFEGKSPSWKNEATGDHLLSIEGFARQKLALDGFDTRTRAREISFPTLVVHGTEDIMVPPQFGQDLAAQIPGADLHRIVGAGHFLPAAGWVGPVLNFLAKHPLPG